MSWLLFNTMTIQIRNLNLFYYASDVDAVYFIMESWIFTLNFSSHIHNFHYWELSSGGVAHLQITQITIKSHHLHLITDSFSILHVFRSVRLLLHVFTTNSHNFTQIYEDSPIVRKIPQVYEKSEGIAHFYEKSERFPCFTLIVYKKF